MITGKKASAFDLFVLATLLALLMLPAVPAAADDRNTCYKASGDVAIAACTRAINSGRFKGQRLAGLYQSRGHEYLKKNELDSNKVELDLAITDFTKAIGIDPTVGCFACRGVARLRAGQLSEALSDCNEALRLKPNYNVALQNRGFTYIKLGQFDVAIADFNAGLKANPKDPEMLYGRGLAKQKKGDKTGGHPDIATAKSIEADIVEKIARIYGPD